MCTTHPLDSTGDGDKLRFVPRALVAATALPRAPRARGDFFTDVLVAGDDVDGESRNAAIAGALRPRFGGETSESEPKLV